MRIASIVLLTCVAVTRAATTQPFDVQVVVDAGKTIGPMHPIWRFFGADEPNYAYMKDGAKLLEEIGQIGPVPKFFRAHNLLTTGDGTPALKWGSTNAYTQDASGRPIYDWTIVDRIFDTCLHAGLKPYVEIGFMPQALSIKPQPYQHHWKPGEKYATIETGWAYPPTDYAKWGELVFQWATHCVEKYGKAEVEQWYWEVWNEANIGYWHGTEEEFFRLHDVAIDAVRRALPAARVGGPDCAGAGGKFMADFLEHCLRGKNYATGKNGTPIDFVSFHAKGNPSFVDGHVRMGIANQLRTIDSAFKMIASYPELKSKPIVIGECDPDGCAACQGPQLGYRNGTMYSSYTAASFARLFALADKHGANLDGALTWAFEFEDQPYFAGFRALATNGIELPVLNVFRMLGKMSGDRIALASSAEVPLDTMLKDGVRSAPDVGALATRDGNRICILIWHYHDDDLPGPGATVHLTVNALPESAVDPRSSEFTIDGTHANAFAAWKQMGAPASPTPQQRATLQRAGQLDDGDVLHPAPAVHGTISISTTLARQAVKLLVFDMPH